MVFLSPFSISCMLDQVWLHLFVSSLFSPPSSHRAANHHHLTSLASTGRPPENAGRVEFRIDDVCFMGVGARRPKWGRDLPFQENESICQKNGKRIFKRKPSTWKVQDARGILVSSKEVIRFKPVYRDVFWGRRLEGFLFGGKSQIGWLHIRQEYAHHESSEIYPDIPCSVVQHGKRLRNWDMHLGHGRGYLRGDAEGERVIKVRDKQIYHEFRFVLTVLV